MGDFIIKFPEDKSPLAIFSLSNLAIERKTKLESLVEVFKINWSSEDRTGL